MVKKVIIVGIIALIMWLIGGKLMAGLPGMFG